MTKKNKSLFWYGFRARMKKSFGGLFLIFGLISFMFNTIVAVLLIVIGIYMLATGSSSEYDYKRQGGHILYND